MNYEIITIETLEGIQEHILIAREDGSFESFRVDEDNPRYQSFLIELEENL